MSTSICKVPGCGKKHFGKGYCNRHYKQIKEYGEIRGNPRRTRMDPNQFIIEGDICKIQLYDRYSCPKAQAIIDKDDLPVAKGKKWFLSGHYVVYHGINKTIRLANVIMRTKVRNRWPLDHRNGNRLDNRKKNLRICTQSQNCWNSRLASNNKTGFKGVSWVKVTGKWRAQIDKQHKRYSLGYFSSKIDAAKAYNEAALILHGEFARLNKIPSEGTKTDT